MNDIIRTVKISELGIADPVSSVNQIPINNTVAGNPVTRRQGTTGTGPVVLQNAPELATPTIDGYLQLAGNQIHGVADPTLNTDGANKQYVDAATALLRVGTTGIGKIVLQNGPSIISPAIAGGTIDSPVGITNVPAPVSPGDAVNKAYADNLAGGFFPLTPVDAATVTTLPANTYANGAAGVGATLTGNSNGALSAQDGVTLTVGQSLLVQNEAAPAHNGIYTLTTVGTGGTPYVLTRRTDYDTSAEIKFGTFTGANGGTANAGKSFIMNTAGTVTVGTTSIAFVPFNVGTVYTNGTGISIAGNVISLNDAVTGTGAYVRAVGATLALTNATNLPDAGVLTGSKLYNRITDEASITDYGADRTGVVSAVTALNNALAAVSRVVIPFGTFLIDATVSVGIGKTLVFEGGQLNITSTHSVALNNQAYVQAGRVQIVATASVGNFSNLKVAYPEWWGAVQSTTVTSNTAFASMLAALRTNGVADLDQGFYALDGTTALTASNGQIFQGKGSYATTIRFPTAAMNFVAYDTTLGGEILNLRLANTAVTPTSGTLISFSTNNAAKARIEDLVVDNCFNFCSFIGTNVTTINDMRMNNFKVAGVQGRGLLLQWAENMWITNGIIDGVGNASPGIDWEDKVQGIYMSGVTASNFNAAGLLVSNAAGAISRGLDARWNKLVECVFDDNQYGLDAVYLSSTEFTNCWFNSNGRTSDRSLGYGVRLRNVTSCRFVQCQFSNNGDHGIRYETPCTFVRFSYCEIFGDNVNNDGSSGAWIQAGASKWSFDHCEFGTGAAWSSVEVNGVIINTGASDYYTVTDCMFASVSGTAVLDNGTGVHKNVTTNNYSF